MSLQGQAGGISTAPQLCGKLQCPAASSGLKFYYIAPGYPPALRSRRNGEPYPTVDIAGSVIVSVDHSSWADDVYILAIGDINIHGALDTGAGSVHLYTPGIVTLDGKIYGENIYVDSGEFHYLNNPNGNPDQHYYGGGTVTIVADGELEYPTGGMLEDTSTHQLTAGAIITSVGLGPVTTIPLESLSLSFPQQYLIFATPIPPTIWLLISAIGLTGFLGRGRDEVEVMDG